MDRPGRRFYTGIGKTSDSTRVALGKCRAASFHEVYIDKTKQALVIGPAPAFFGFLFKYQEDAE